MLLEQGCPTHHIQNPRGSVELIQNNNITSHSHRHQGLKHSHTGITQLQPQNIRLQLRPGEPQMFEVKFKRVEDYPIDLYYLMDLSFSMEDDLVNVKKLGTDLMEEMKNITGDFRMGFGAFVDKTVIPYISTTEEMLQNPCKRTEPMPCAPPFSFQNVLSLTCNGTLFSQLVGEQRISGNLDSPEGGLDALMQAAVCEEHIGWRNVTRLLVFSTDAGFHFAGDGKLGGIVLPNDGKCHLENNRYTMGDRQDYPSISQLAEKLREKNIQVIFTVTRDVIHLYEGLKALLPKSTVGTLSNNSHNVRQLIVEAYNALTSEVIMDTSELPEGYEVSFSTFCKDHIERSGEEGKRCSNISIGDQIVFKVTVLAPACVSGTGRSRLVIRPQGYTEEVEVELSTLCECPCQSHSIPESPVCSDGNGTLECGACRCKEGRAGTFCECHSDFFSQLSKRDLCRRDNFSEVCSGHGECVCGKCMCGKSPKNIEHIYYGRYCECDNFRCDQYQGQICGGRGNCECGVCQCFPGFTGSRCECSLAIEPCVSENGLVCAGRGVCECGICICADKRYHGPTCSICPSCPNTCTQHRQCVLCRVFNQELSEEQCERECGHINITLLQESRQLPQGLNLQQCKERDADHCWVHFTYQEIQRGSTVFIHAALNRECPSGPDIVVITVVLSVTIVIVGVALLLMWKLITTIQDHKEFIRFQNELEKARWEAGDNPIYRSAVTITLNPKYKAQ
ncbi:integrin beta-1-like [Chanos chanos]|uniref:Integrin beta n=1 Tax=Chanos chanos TaxID=29144 RepID=A0A6J2VG84_CHACN|nr:integrin beta-1-like [Chanos chanos]